MTSTALAAATFSIGKSFGAVGANDKIRIALIGARNMGWGNLADAMATKQAECVAICDTDKNVLNKRLADAQKKFGAKPLAFSDYRKVLERKDIDAVIIGTPDHWHCLQTCDACEDVYVEKPIANSIVECDAMTAHAKKYARVVSVGQQQDSSQMWRKVIDTALSGKPTNSEHFDHLKNFFDCMRSRKFATACTIENGAFCAKLAHLGNISARVAKTISYDETKKSFGDKDADALLKPQYRAPWKFPTV